MTLQFITGSDGSLCAYRCRAWLVPAKFGPRRTNFDSIRSISDYPGDTGDRPTDTFAPPGYTPGRELILTVH